MEHVCVLINGIFALSDGTYVLINEMIALSVAERTVGIGETGTK